MTLKSLEGGVDILAFHRALLSLTRIVTHQNQLGIHSRISRILISFSTDYLYDIANR